jgi:polar amino acid transport system substrate-binding protein
MPNKRGHAFAAALMLLLLACDLPRDPEGTLDRVQGGVMRVGISDNPPWTLVEAGRVDGVESMLVEDLARELGARIEWIHGTENELLDALHRFELDLVIAGLTDDTPWTGKVGLSQAYVETSSLVGVPQDVEPVGDDIEGREVAVPLGNAVAAHVRSEGGTPQPVPDLTAARLLVAAEDWQLAAWNYAVRPESRWFQHTEVVAA